MSTRSLASLSWKAAGAVAAGALILGTGAATSYSLIDDTHADTEHHQKVEAPTTTSTTADDGGDASHTVGHDADATAKADANAEEHPDNFGAIVSADAHDGGVDGQEISDMAHERNDARAAAREAEDDNAKDAEHGASDDHRQDAEHGQDD